MEGTIRILHVLLLVLLLLPVLSVHVHSAP
jgi:hypothetical protein